MESEKIKIFQSAKKNFAAIYLEQNKRPFHRMQLLYILQNFLAVSLQFLYLVFDANTAREYMNSILVTKIGVLVYAGYLSTIFKTATIYDFIIDLEKVINERLKYPKSKAMYTKTNQLIETICTYTPFFIVYVVVPGFVLPKAICCFFKYFTTDLGPDAFELPFPTWFPFDWKNPFGYLIAILLQIRIALKPIRFIGSFGTFGIGCFLFAMSLAKDVKGDIHSINKNARTHRTREHIHAQLIEFIRFTNLKRLLSRYAEINRIIIILLFLGCIGVIIISLLIIEIDFAQIKSEFDPLILLASIIMCIGALLLVFAVCEFGQRFTNAFNEVDDDLTQVSFYLLPPKVQQLLPVIILYSQEPLVVRFFGSICLTREQFKKVIRIVYQYFMVLREVYD